MPMPMISRRLPRSASRAIGSPSKAYTLTKAQPFSTLNCVSLMPRCERIGATSRVRMPRSTVAIMSPMVRTISAYQARPGRGQSESTVRASIDGFSLRPPGRFNRQGTATPPVRNCARLRCARAWVMTLTVNRLGPQFANGDFAAEILGADLHEPPSDALVDTVELAMATYAVVVVRGQEIDDEEQVRFARAFGPLELPPHMGMRPAAMKVRVGFGLYDISNLDPEGQLPAGRLFAADLQQEQRELPYRQLIQHVAHQVVDVVGAGRPPRGWRYRVLRRARRLGRVAGRTARARPAGHGRALVVEDPRRRGER
jgi:hypothetical protein